VPQGNGILTPSNNALDNDAPFKCKGSNHSQPKEKEDELAWISVASNATKTIKQFQNDHYHWH
jgi:hypothetical protein